MSVQMQIVGLLFVTIHVFAQLKGIDFDYQLGGDDWPGLCQTGMRQSPIDVRFPGYTTPTYHIYKRGCDLGAALEGGAKYYHPGHIVLNRAGQSAPSFHFGASDDIFVSNIGGGIVWLFDGNFSNIKIPVQGKLLSGLFYEFNQKLDLPSMLNGGMIQHVNAEFVNFHIHSPSEHLYNGFLAPLEGHFVLSIPQSNLDTCPPSGCISVVSVHFMYDKFDSPNPFLEQTLWSLGGMWPSSTGETLLVNRTLDFNQLIPANPSYMLYDGSLTTPPCTEGVLWHVIEQPLTVSTSQVRALQNAIGATSNAPTNSRRPQPINDRPVIYHTCV
eukprot:TRINITY_DN903_c0_g1_i11.p2 TRINITY_DN903_c0_g1~~TRINITY_DN903_c0_g1_i11.p2  ORF type:complete len:328 (-),score=37.17 TRINITY_DN903_c0_g1_i11:2075-3058(-)